MPDLASSRLLEPTRKEAGAVRVCTNLTGQSWAEEVTHFSSEVRSFQVRFRTEDVDFPYPMRTMFGGWSVTPTESSARVCIWWSVTPKVLMAPWLLVALMGAGIDRDFPPLVVRMAEAANGRPVPLNVKRARLAAAYC